MGDSRPSGLGMTFLVGGVILLLAVVVLVSALAPLFECPECEGGRVGVVTRISGPMGSSVTGCTDCEGKGRVTLLKKWNLLRNAPPR